MIMNRPISLESPEEFSRRANALLLAALKASIKEDGGDQSAFRRCMSNAKAQRMTWVEGLEFTIAMLEADRF